MSDKRELSRPRERTVSDTIGDIASLASNVFRDATDINKANPPTTLTDGKNYSFTRIGGAMAKKFELRVKKGEVEVKTEDGQIADKKTIVGVLTFSKGVSGIDGESYSEYTNGKIDQERETSVGIEPDKRTLKKMELRLKLIGREQMRLLSRAWSL